MSKKLFTLLPLLAIVLAFGLWIQKSSAGQRLSNMGQETSPVQVQDQIYASPTLSQEIDQQTLIELEADVEGQTAFDLLKTKASVAYKEYEFGVFIESINGLAGDAGHYWALYVNGEYAQAGADQTVLNQGDRIEFRYEEIKSDLFEETAD
ncbi:MAG: DUF4430 domain-containing protein [Patescibacteria group bacterium]